MNMQTTPSPRLFVFSGAGLSAESGLSTFRVGSGALWDGHDIRRVCDFDTWKNYRQEVHAFYNARRSQLAGVEPNEAHLALARWQRRWDTKLLTQNVDDLLERAGCTDVIHLHGSLRHMLCTACGHEWEIGYEPWDHEEGRCPKCQSRRGVKPHVVFFHENAPNYVHMNRVFKNLTRNDVVLVIGTSCEVIPFHFMLMGKQSHNIIVGLNPREELGSENCSMFDTILSMPATQAVGVLEKELVSRLGEGRNAIS